MCFSLRRSAAMCVLAGPVFCIGCASPGPPRAPSLNLPAAPKNLTAERIGPTVVLRFTVPQRTTDDLAIHSPSLGLRVCREVATAPCTTVPQLPNMVSTRNAQGDQNVVSVTETLPTELATGAPRVIGYRAQLISQRGRPGPLSDAVYVAAGRAPASVEGLAAAGSRLGILLSWSPAQPDGSEVILHREPIAPTPSKAAGLLFRSSDDSTTAPQNRTLDTSAADGAAYRYTAWRESKITLGGRTLTLRSETSLPVAFTLHDTFPPPVPTDLTAAAFTTDGHYSVDLIWQPVEDPSLAGYNAYRESVDEPASPRIRLNATPLPTPAFHDNTAKSTTRYRYSVTSIDRKGNESNAATATVEPNR